jgi:hypothetical protein
MAAGGRNLERAFGAFLALDVAQIELRPPLPPLFPQSRVAERCDERKNITGTWKSGGTGISAERTRPSVSSRSGHQFFGRLPEKS